MFVYVQPIFSYPIEPFFKKLKFLEEIQCNKFFETGSQEYLQEFVKSRVIFDDEMLELKTDCDSIKQRHYFANSPNSKFEADFPIAFARIVYRDYFYLEMELAAEYAPQNVFCYALDFNAKLKFKVKMRSLASCFPNIFVLEEEFDIKGRSKNMNWGHIKCLEELRKYKWKYAVTLHNHDILLKTNRELVQIFTWMEGANDVLVTPAFMHRVTPNLSWTFQDLRLFRNGNNTGKKSEESIGAVLRYLDVYHPFFERRGSSATNTIENDWAASLMNDPQEISLITKDFSKNYVISNEQGPMTPKASPSIRLANGYDQCSLSREFVDYLFVEMDITILVHQINNGIFGTNEILFASLHNTDELNAPGGFTYLCMGHAKHITRLTNWVGGELCVSKMYRNNICIYGVEDINNLIFHSPFLFVNKIMPEFDFAALVCLHEKKFNMTYREIFIREKLDEKYYTNLNVVRFNREKKLHGYVYLKKFNCSFP